MKLEGRPCLVVGGGEIAARKASLLLQARARVRVVAPRLARTLTALERDGRVAHAAREFRDSDLTGVYLAIAATDDAAVNRRVYEMGQARALPVNVVDQPELCSFVMPAIIDRSPVVAAVSASGASPVLARLLRTRFESLLPAAYGRLAEFARSMRARVKATIRQPAQRRLFWERTLQGPVAELVFNHRDEAAREAFEQALERAGESAIEPGEVYLVGAGPGDPDLLTFRALRLMQQADVVVHDRLVSPAVLDLTRRDAERIYAGKSRGQHAMAQESVNQLLVRLAREGKRVLRLKGGDPFIFGRGGEEIDTLASEGIAFQVVPGITAASGCAAYAGIPLTHRDHAHSCVFVAGHLRDGSVDLDWEQLARPKQTVVVYMGLVGLRTVCRQLAAHGMACDTPAALIEQGTLSAQRVFTGTLSTLPGLIEHARVRAPTLIIIGHVVRLHESLKWFGDESGPARRSSNHGRESEPARGDEKYRDSSAK